MDLVKLCVFSWTAEIFRMCEEVASFSSLAIKSIYYVPCEQCRFIIIKFHEQWARTGDDALVRREMKNRGVYSETKIVRDNWKVENRHELQPLFDERDAKRAAFWELKTRMKQIACGNELALEDDRARQAAAPICDANNSGNNGAEVQDNNNSVVAADAGILVAQPEIKGFSSSKEDAIIRENLKDLDHQLVTLRDWTDFKIKEEDSFHKIVAASVQKRKRMYNHMIKGTASLLPMPRRRQGLHPCHWRTFRKELEEGWTANPAGVKALRTLTYRDNEFYVVVHNMGTEQEPIMERVVYLICFHWALELHSEFHSPTGVHSFSLDIRPEELMRNVRPFEEIVIGELSAVFLVEKVLYGGIEGNRLSLTTTKEHMTPMEKKVKEPRKNRNNNAGDKKGVGGKGKGKRRRKKNPGDAIKNNLLAPLLGVESLDEAEVEELEGRMNLESEESSSTDSEREAGRFNKNTDEFRLEEDGDLFEDEVLQNEWQQDLVVLPKGGDATESECEAINSAQEVEEDGGSSEDDAGKIIIDAEEQKGLREERERSGKHNIPGMHDGYGSVIFLLRGSTQVSRAALFVVAHLKQ